MDGYVKVYRKLLDNPLVCKDADHLAVWLYLLLHATHREHAELFRGEKILLKPGQLLTGRQAIAAKLKLNENKVQRILKTFEKEQQIEQQASNKNRLITICKWQEYQGGVEQQDEQQMNNKRTTAEQQLNTYKNEKNDKNVKNEKKYIDLPAEDLCKNPGGFYAEVARLYNEICQSYPRLTKLSEARKKAIAARKNSGYTLADFQRLFELAEASSFLRGANNRNWQATFDWLLKDANMAKVLDGNYTDKGRPEAPKATGSKTLDDVFAEASRILQAEQGAKADDGN